MLGLFQLCYSDFNALKKLSGFTQFFMLILVKIGISGTIKIYIKNVGILKDS